MTVIGLDIGTTSLSAAVIDAGDRSSIVTQTRPGPGFLPSDRPWERVQSAASIVSEARDMLDALIDRYAPSAIGLSGQMHGYVPVDGAGKAVGPLYTWQDARAGLTEEGPSVSDALSQIMRAPVAPGYGLATAVWNARHGVDRDMAGMATIGAYVGMALTGRGEPLLHVSDAASLGGWDLAGRGFEPAAARACHALPRAIDGFAWLGQYRGIPVSVSLGDNQAAVLGATGGDPRCVVVNIGTGSQVCAISDTLIEGDFETRPYVGGRWLLTQCGLCGGRAYALFERFVRACAALAGADADRPLYDKLNELAMMTADDGLEADTRFSGTRADPSLRGCYRGIDENNLTPGHLARATLRGIVNEMKAGYDAIAARLDARPARLIGSGNAVRKNAAMRSILSETFGLTLTLGPCEEDAAYGAALFALGGLETSSPD